MTLDLLWMQEALLYSTEAQTALIDADWPEALLSHDRCRPIYAESRYVCLYVYAVDAELHTCELKLSSLT